MPTGSRLPTPRHVGLLPLALALAFAVRPLAAQLEAGDAAWRDGRHDDARRAYEQVLATDPASVRANYRLGILASWANRLDSALVLLRRARRADPADPDVRFTEAQVLSWASRYDEAIAKFDSLIALAPYRTDAPLARARTLAWAGRYAAADSAYGAMLDHRPDDVAALTGRGQVHAWQGDYAGAIAAYREALARDSSYPDALVGLGNVYQWQGRPAQARTLARQALGREPANREATRLLADARAATRPRLEVTLGWSRDSDRNENWWETLGTSALVAPGLRAFATGGLGQASDPVRSADRALGEVGASYAVGKVQLTAAAGARRLSPSGGATRSPATWRGSLAWRPARTVGVGLGYARYPFDETALLVGSRLDLDALEASADVSVAPRTSLSLGGGVTWFSDGNRRTSGIAALMQAVTPRLSVGALTRTLGYRDRGTGYFSPDRFTLAEARASYAFASGPWSVRAAGGLGAQWISPNPVQAAWRVEGRVGRRWAVIDKVELFGSISRNAANSAAGAFVFRTAGVSATIGL